MRKHTELLRASISGWLYRHDWQLACVLAVPVVAVAAYVLWPRPTPAVTLAPVISADEVDAAQERTVIVYISGAVRSPGLYTLAAAFNRLRAMG